MQFQSALFILKTNKSAFIKLKYLDLQNASLNVP